MNEKRDVFKNRNFIIPLFLKIIKLYIFSHSEYFNLCNYIFVKACLFFFC